MTLRLFARQVFGHDQLGHEDLLGPPERRPLPKLTSWSCLLITDGRTIRITAISHNTFPVNASPFAAPAHLFEAGQVSSAHLLNNSETRCHGPCAMTLS